MRAWRATLLVLAGLLVAAGPARTPAGRWSEVPANPCKLKPGGEKGKCDKKGNWIVEVPTGLLLHAPDGKRYLLPPPLPATG